MVLPDRLHTVWTLPEGDADFAMRWQLIKAAFSRREPKEFPEVVQPKVSGASGSADIRSAPFATIDFARHVDYVHINPVKHRLVDRVRDWAPSSFHRHVELDNYPADWTGDQSDDDRDCGER